MGLDGGFLKFTRLEPRHEPVEERIKHFNEFIAIYSDTEGREQASRCMDCGIPFCQHQCPLHNTMPDTQQYVSDGDWESAWRVLDSTNSFPEITGRICPAPCEEGCTLGLHRDAVSFFQVTLGNFKEFPLGFLHKVIYVVGLVKGLVEYFAGKFD